MKLSSFCLYVFCFIGNLFIVPSTITKEITHNYYLYLGKELSNITDFVLEISSLDNNPHSPLSDFKKYIEEGFFVAEHDAVVELLQYIELFLQKNYSVLEPVYAQEITINLNTLIDQVIEGSLKLDEMDLYTKKGLRTFTNIMEVKGLLSVNDQLVQNITAVNLSVSDEIINGSLTVSAFTPSGIIHNNGSGLLSSSLIVNGDIDAAAGIVDTKLATISTAGKVSNSATTATSANTANAIVARDSSGNFSAGVVSVVDAIASGNIVLTQNPSSPTSGNILKGSVQFIHNYGLENTFVGESAGNFTTTGYGNTGMGKGVLAIVSSGSDNIAIGRNSLANATTAFGNTIIGSNALYSGQDATYNAAVGYQALFSGTSCRRNCAMGSEALTSNLAGDDNTALGYRALTYNTESSNTAVGASALLSNTTGTPNIAIGFESMHSNTVGYNNIAAGNYSLYYNTTGINNVVIGHNSCFPNTTGSYNTALGTDSLASNTTGQRNTALGHEALLNNISGNYNTAVGADALFNNSTGSNNTVFGYRAGQLITTGNTNIAIGYQAGSTLTTGSSNIYIGANASATGEASTTRIGSSQTRTFISGIRGVTTGSGSAIAVLIDPNGQLGTTSSSKKYKHNIENMADKSTDIYKLRPVTFAYNSDKSETEQYGLIAEEVDQVFPTIVAKDADGQVETVQYHVLPVLILNELQKLAARVAVLEARNNPL